MSTALPELKLEPGLGRSKSQRLTEYLRTELAAGRLSPGDWLPSEQALATAAGLARNTVRRALADLERDGHVRRIPGRGTVVDGKSPPAETVSQRAGAFALIVPDARRGFYPALLSEFGNAARGLHRQVTVWNSENDVHRQADIILQLMDSRVSGVAMVPATNPPTPPYHIQQLQDRGVPVVFCHRRVEEIAAPLVAVPFYEVGHLAGKTVAQRGHRRVLFIGSSRFASTPLFCEGLRSGLQAGGCDVPYQLVDIGDNVALDLKEEDYLPILQQTFAGDERPTAIVTTFDAVSEMIYVLMPQLGLRVPEDVSLIGFGDACREGALAQRLSSVVIDEAAVGRKAVSLLHEMLCGHRSVDNNEEIVMEVGLSEGKTLAAPPLEA